MATSPSEPSHRHTPGSVAGTALGVAELLARGASASIAAVPGAGLTRTLEAVHAHLLEACGVHPDEVLVLTPNRAHADSLRDRLSAGARAVRTGAGARSFHSLAFGLVSAETAATMGEASRFLSGADQDAILRTLLEGFEAGRVRAPQWPEAFSPEMRATHAFRDQLREALDVLLVRGITPVQAQQAGSEAGRGEWLALAQVLQDYRDQLSFAGYGGVDTSGVLAEAAAIVDAQAEQGRRAGQQWSFSPERIPRCVLVDAAQDVPDAGLALLRGLTGTGCAVAVFGSPDASTQAFRGAGALLAEWTRTLTAGEVEGRTFVLSAQAPGTRGAGPVRDLCLSLSRRLSAHLGLGHVPASAPQRSEADSEVGRSGLQVLTHASAAERTRFVARLIRTWHHDSGVAFDDIAVIARSNATAVGLRAELGALGLPVESTDLPLADDPATAPLLSLLADDLADPTVRAGLLRSLLTGVYGGVDALSLKEMRREAVRALRTAGLPDSEEPLLAWTEAGTRSRLPEPLARAAGMLERGEAVRGQSPHAALWELWETSGVAEEWRTEVLRDPRSPHRERLDAVMRLFALARKLEDTVGLDAEGFAARVQEQVYAQDSLSRSDAEDLVTVDSPAAVSHRSFSRVVVVDVDEGSWPNPRIRRNAFAPGELVAHLEDPVAAGVEFAPGEAMKEARRQTIRDEGGLFLAAVSRAEDELVVCALDDGETSPSAFHHMAGEYAGGPVTRASRPAGAAERAAAEGGIPAASAADVDALASVRMLAEELIPARLRDIVGRARQGLLTESAPEDWARLVAALARAGLREADPATWSTWFGTSSSLPVRAADESLRIRPSQVEAFATCPLQWFLMDNGGRPGETVVAASLGTAVHRIAEDFPEPDRAAMLAEFDEIFDYSLLASEWERERTRKDAASMIDALIDYLRFSREEMAGRCADAEQATGTAPVSAVHTEAQVSAFSPEGASGGPWRISGRADRLEQVGDHMRVVDFKTGKVQPSAADVQANPQLAAYQYALAEGEVSVASADGGPGTALRALRPAGAALVHLRKGEGRGRGGLPRTVREQSALDRDTEVGAELHAAVSSLIDSVAIGMRAAEFPATPGKHCAHCPVRSSCPAMTALTAEGGGAE